VKTRILPFVSAKHRSLFSFGLAALTFQKYSSLNSNARCVVENINTAHSKIYRLVSNKRFLFNFYNLVSMSGFVTRKSLVNVDFSSFCGFETLAFAVQTQMGRALPVWADCLTYPIKKIGSQNLFILKNIKLFKKALGFYPRFVFDRGFMIPSLIEFLLKEKVIFYLRIKKGKKLLWIDKKGNPKKQTAEQIGKKTKDTTVFLYGKRLRLVVSPVPKDPDSKGKKEPWYILSTDERSSRKKILKVYRQRFEIEESFKDLKHLFNLKKLVIKKKLTFKILLWFQIISFWLSYWCTKKKEKLRKKLTNKHKLHSYPRMWFEGIQREIRKELIFHPT
jgi:hypothetical protein